MVWLCHVVSLLCRCCVLLLCCYIGVDGQCGLNSVFVCECQGLDVDWPTPEGEGW